jgi:hypothetical protein
MYLQTCRSFKSLKSSGPQTTNLQITNLQNNKKDWARKWQIRKMSQLQKVRKFSAAICKAYLRTAHTELNQDRNTYFDTQRPYDVPV